MTSGVPPDPRSVEASRRSDGDSSEWDKPEFEFETESIEAGHSDSELWLLPDPVRSTHEKPLARFFITRVAFTDAEGLRWTREGRDEPHRQFHDRSRSS